MTTVRRPTIFELVACDRLKHSLREGLRHLLESFKHMGISESTVISRYSDEIVLFLDLIIESSYLRTHSSSYAENLFNLTRQSGDSRDLQDNILTSVLSLVVAPYFKQKLDAYFDRVNYKTTQTQDDLRRIKLYRLISKSVSFLEIIMLARYAAGKSSYPNLTSRLLNVRLRLRDHEDEMCNNSLNSTLSLRVAAMTAGFVGHCLSVGSYVIQFLDHWNTHSNSASLFNASLPIPNAPERGPNINFSDEASSKICLICSKERQNECVLSNTGYVFCYGCIYDYVITRRKCPVSGISTGPDNIVKLYSLNQV